VADQDWSFQAVLIYEVLDIFRHQGIVVPRIMGRVAMVAQVL
jgi:hypothetical protein